MTISMDIPHELVPLDTELKSLLQSMRAASASRVERITKIAMQHVGSSILCKSIVLLIVNFIHSCPSEMKLSGLYIVDSVCRASLANTKKSGISSDPYVENFIQELNLSQEIKKCPLANMEKVKRLIRMWKETQLFPDEFLDISERERDKPAVLEVKPVMLPQFEKKLPVFCSSLPAFTVPLPRFEKVKECEQDEIRGKINSLTHSTFSNTPGYIQDKSNAAISRRTYSSLSIDEVG